MRLLSVAITLGALLACSPASPTEPDEAPAKEKSGKKKTKVGKKKPVASQVPCDVKVIIGANASLLEAPKAGSKRIAIVPKGSMGVLTAQRGNLVRFAEGWTPNKEETHYSTGWIDVTRITTELMSPLEYPGIAPVKLRKSPSAQAPSEAATTSSWTWRSCSTRKTTSKGGWGPRTTAQAPSPTATRTLPIRRAGTPGTLLRSPHTHRSRHRAGRHLPATTTRRHRRKVRRQTGRRR
jgi:hypothetical protein